MSTNVVRAEYFHATVKDRPGEAYRLLSELAESEVNLLAFNVFPAGGHKVQLMLFPEDVNKFIRAAERFDFTLTGPQRALLVRGDDRLGALVEIHHRLFDGGINVYAASGVTAGGEQFGYLIYVKDDQFEEAAHLLGA